MVSKQLAPLYASADCACSAEKQKYLAALWRKSMQAAALFPVVPVDSGVSLE